VPVLVAIGVREDGTRLVLGLQAGDKESAANWRESFKDLKSRGLRGEGVTLGVMDGLTGLEIVFKEEFGNAQVQRCQVQVARNVLTKKFTNIIERLNKEFKRRTNSMEIVAENACYRLLAFISLKMEMHWKRNPIGKAAYHLPIFQRVPLAEFT
jgi:transposase-like protein